MSDNNQDNQKDSKIREDRFTWKAGEVEWIPPEKNKPDEQK